MKICSKNWRLVIQTKGNKEIYTTVEVKGVEPAMKNGKINGKIISKYIFPLSRKSK